MPTERHVKPRVQLLALTGLRAFAAIWVVLLHLKDDLFLLLPGSVIALPFISKGYFAVDLFFVLSGFILGYTYFEKYRGTRTDYLEFLSHRLARIYPVQLFTLLVLVVMLLGARLIHANISDSRYDPASFVYNVLLIHSWGLEDWNTWNQPSWSLSAEWFAYVSVFPLAWVVLKRISRPAWVLGLLVASIAAFTVWCQLTPGDNLARFIVRVTCEFFAGCCAYVLYTRVTSKATEPFLNASVAGGFCVIWFLRADSLWLNPLMISFFVILVFGLATSKGVIAQVLGSRAVVYAGEVSFSLYMIHGILQKVFKIALPAARFAHSSPGARVGVVLVYGLGLSICSVLTYTLIERPARQRLRSVLAPQGATGRVPGVAGDLLASAK
jgi:peptidoglycan/LPS O-acetylase OafA/YrhL